MYRRNGALVNKINRVVLFFEFVGQTYWELGTVADGLGTALLKGGNVNNYRWASTSASVCVVEELPLEQGFGPPFVFR